MHGAAGVCLQAGANDGFRWRSRHAAQKLVATLDVRYGARAQAVEPVGKGCRVLTDSIVLSCGNVILAVPAPSAKAPCSASIGGAASALLATSYSSGVMVSCRTLEEYLLSDPLRHVYGLLVPGSVRSDLAAIGIESKKFGQRPGGRVQLLNLMLSNDAAKGATAMPDAFLTALVLRAAGKYLPGLESMFSSANVYRWRSLVRPLAGRG